MPEKGDQVRIYFPSKRTGEVIAISAVSTYESPTAKAAGGSQGSTLALGSPGGGVSGGGSSGGGSSFQGGNSSGGGGGSGTSSSGGGSSPGGSNSGGGTGAAGSSMGAAAGAAIAGGADAAEDAGKDKMGDPSTKYLRVPSGQQIKLAPDGIKILCSGGSVKIEVLKSGKINLSASDSIQISAKSDITLKAKYAMKVQCKETAYLASQMGGSIQMDKEGKLIIQGTEVHVN